MRSITGMGVEYECRISRARAQQLIGEGKDLPLMGWERLLKEVPDSVWPISFTDRLWLKNISGVFVLASETTKVSSWAKRFGPEFAQYAAKQETPA